MSTLTREDKKFYIVVFITVLIMYGFGFLVALWSGQPAGHENTGYLFGLYFCLVFGDCLVQHFGAGFIGDLCFGTMGANFWQRLCQ